MEIGNQIKALRARRGVTQEALAEALGITAQAVSKWETGAAAPDIQLLPDISAYFGVTVDELFALTDEKRMERIENMLASQRAVEPHILDREAAFLLDRTRREPQDPRTWSLLAQLENDRGDECKRRAGKYARESLRRRADNKSALWELARSAGIQGPYWELADSHRDVIDHLLGFVKENPGVQSAYHWLMVALLLDRRFGEAMEVCERYAWVGDPVRAQDYRGLITWLSGDREGALKIWDEMAKGFSEHDEGWGIYAQDYAMTGDYLGAAGIVDRCKPGLSAPRPTWPWEMGAYYRELGGDIAGAIRELETFLRIRREEYGFSGDAGEEWLNREMARLREKE